ncbi:MAG: glycosyltransferase family 4 protein, partial [Deltaproteobacteria bacterium]|nr:glycosyltransferase family 4 protein [Deltaproteobacteria bacterium]
YQGDQGGSTKSMIYLSKGLASRGHKVFFGCREQSLIYRSLLNSNVTVVHMSFSRFGGTAPGQMVILCREQNIQIINAQSSQDRYAVLRARFFHGVKSKVVFTRRQMPNSSRLSGLLSTVGAHRIIAVSSAVADALSRRWIDRSKIEVIYNGIPAGKCNNIDEDEVQKLRSRLRIPEGATVIGCIARKKLQDVLIRACPFLPPEAVILLVGPGKPKDWCRIINKLKPPQRIIMLEYQERILPYYHLLTVSVLPSLIEGLSQTLLESMAIGVPVVASRWGGNPEVIEDGLSGLLFSPTDPIDLAEKINRVLEGRDFAESLREHSRRRVLETFNIEQTVERTEDCFKRLLDDI